jgi:hypothetical protein
MIDMIGQMSGALIDCIHSQFHNCLGMPNHAYPEKVASTYNIDELESLVRDLVQWLYCIGLPYSH